MTWAGDTTPIGKFVQNEITALTGANYESAVQLGFYGSPALTGGSGANVAASVAAVKADVSTSKGLEVVFYEKIGVGDGSYANNPFLQ